MTVLSPDLRSLLEKAIVAARDAAEATCREALSEFGVEADRAGEHLSDNDRRLRVALRAEARQLGGFDRLVEESAYEQWHRMLFARFLAENDLLIHPDHGVAVSLADCEEIAHARGHSDPWVVASEFAATMLPGIFGSGDPVLQLKLAPEGQQRLEEILAELPRAVFESEDGLGWVYQYWQSKKKKEVNASERKIGGADIAPVTQLFTEHYMVRFLLENTLGAWWAARHPESPLVREWEYLRFDDEDQPAAGSFPGWPDTLRELTVMDPCCGSGHFLVAAFEMLRKMRVEAESLSSAEAGDAVLRDNLFGFELDARCTQIAAFALALQAWKTGGYRDLPIPNIACSGISAKGRLDDWKKLAHGDERLERALERLHGVFGDAGDLGSLIDPTLESDGELLAAQFDEVAPLLDAALYQERIHDPSTAVFGSATTGAVRALRLLVAQYTLVTTNPPFLGRGKQGAALMAYAEREHPRARADLSTCFVERNLRLSSPGGSVAMVTPQAWLFLTTYTSLRVELLANQTWRMVARLGPGAFEAISGHVVNVALIILSEGRPAPECQITGIDVSAAPGPSEKAAGLRGEGSESRTTVVKQAEQARNPDARLTLEERSRFPTLGSRCICRLGLGTGDAPHYIRKFWEVTSAERSWRFLQMASTQSGAGREHVVTWDDRSMKVRGMSDGERRQAHNQDYRGREAWGRVGVAVSLVGGLRPSTYRGDLFDKSLAVIIPNEPSELLSVAAFVSSAEFVDEVRKLDRKLMVTNATLLKVPFDAERWKQAGNELYPTGLPDETCDEPSQWTFSGSLRHSASSLHVAVGRLVGYRWPAELGVVRGASEITLARAKEARGLAELVDDDGIVCIPALRRERPAAERLRALIAAALGEEWSPAKESDLLAEAGQAGKSLEQWLRDEFFEQHCQLFHQRPFVWQVWDGRKDGFSALVNYHRLDRANLEKLIYTYLGDWIRVQREAAAAGTAGADLRLAAAQELHRNLELILDGEAPYDIFVRWKALEEQPIGWDPDLNDGVRLNIRPFVSAGVLRRTPNIKWGKDRGKDPESAPWFQVFAGDRVNDHHLGLNEKREARERAARKSA